MSGWSLVFRQLKSLYLFLCVDDLREKETMQLSCLCLEDVHKRLGMENCNGISTLIEYKLKLQKTKDAVITTKQP